MRRDERGRRAGACGQRVPEVRIVRNHDQRPHISNFSSHGTTRWNRIRFHVLKFLRGPVRAHRYFGVQIGESCNIRSNIMTSEPWLIELGDRVTVSFGVRFITHDGLGRFYKDEQGRRYRYGRIRVGSDVFIGAGSIIMPGVRIGDNCVVGAGAVVTKNVPAGRVVAGVPAKQISTWADVMVRVADWPTEREIASIEGTYRAKVTALLGDS